MEQLDKLLKGIMVPDEASMDKICFKHVNGEKQKGKGCV